MLNDIMGGRIPLVIEAYSGIAGAVAAGSIRALAVASEQRVGILPDLPTVAETLPGFAASGWQVLVAPVGTPETIIRKVNADLIKAMADPETRQQFAKFNREERPLSPEQTTAFIHDEQRKWGPILRQIARAP